MAERPAARPRPVAAAPERDDNLAALNDHLGRFLRQADALLDDWTRFSADVRIKSDRCRPAAAVRRGRTR